MTEAEWLAEADPHAMLYALSDRASERKLRLFACACCWRILPLLTDERSRQAVRVAERFADGRATVEELAAARAAAGAVTVAETERLSAGDGDDDEGAEGFASAIAEAVAAPCGRVAAELTASRAGETIRVATDLAEAAPEMAPWLAKECAAEALIASLAGSGSQVAILSDLFGHLFIGVAVSQDWLAWGGGTVPKLARDIYDKRAFDHLPLLADALEDAGCGDPELLGHLRGSGPHVRGCWAVDLLLGKE